MTNANQHIYHGKKGGAFYGITPVMHPEEILDRLVQKRKHSFILRFTA